MFHALAEKVSAECHSVHGKSNIPEKSKWLYREHKIPELGEVFYACTGRTYEGDRAGISQEKIKQTISLCQSDENIIKVFTGQ